MDSTLSSPPGFSPKLMSSRTLQAIHRSSVTRATAANRMPVVRHTMSRIVGIALMLLTAAMSCSSVLLMLTASAHLIDLMVPDALCRAVDAKIKKERDRFDLCFDHSAKRFEARRVDAIQSRFIK